MHLRFVETFDGFNDIDSDRVMTRAAATIETTNLKHAQGPSTEILPVKLQTAFMLHTGLL